MKSTRIWLSLIVVATCLLVSDLYAHPVTPHILRLQNKRNEQGVDNYLTCDTPSAQPRYIGIGAASDSSISGSFEAAANVNSYLVVISINSRPEFLPVTGTSYPLGSTIGNVKIVKAGPGTNFTAIGLTANTNYYIYVYSMNDNCSSGTVYRSYNPAAVLVHTTN